MEILTRRPPRRPRLSLAQAMTLVAFAAGVLWAYRRLCGGDLFGVIVVCDVVWIGVLARVIRGRSRDGRLF